MQKAIILFLAMTTLLSCNNQTAENSVISTETYVIVLSMDGFRWDYAEGINTPNFDRMAKSGVKARMQSAFPTKTFPNHYTIATGLYPDNHGIVNNNFYDPQRNLTYEIPNRQMVQDAYFYGGEPIWNTAEKQGVKAATYFWVGSEAPVQNMRPSIWKIYDGSTGFYQRADSVIAWLQLPEIQRPHLIMWYIDQPDGIGHDFGPGSSELKNQILALDSILGYFLDQLAALPHASKINFILTSDHGMEEISTERYVSLGEHIPEHWIENSTGGNPVLNIWEATGYHDSLMNAFSQLNHLKAYDKNTIPVGLHYMSNPRCGDIVVVADSAYSIGFKSVDGYAIGGTHGYDPANTNMDVIFLAFGPAFKEGFSGPKIQNVDLYNLIAKILHLVPAPNDGDSDGFLFLK